MEELGVQKLRRHGTDAGIFDILGLSSGNASIGNLSMLKAFMDKSSDGGS